MLRKASDSSTMSLDPAAHVGRMGTPDFCHKGVRKRPSQ